MGNDIKQRPGTNTNKMSNSNTGSISIFNKSEEDFIWWVKKAIADINNDGLVSKESFS